MLKSHAILIFCHLARGIFIKRAKMKKIVVVALILLLCGSSLFAAQSAPHFSGQDYLNLSYQKRAEVIASFIEHGKGRGITISKGPAFYCRKLDTFYAKHPDFAKEALFTVLKTLIIMEYDWDKRGLDKDLLACKWLGEELLMNVNYYYPLTTIIFPHQ